MLIYNITLQQKTYLFLSIYWHDNNNDSYIYNKINQIIENHRLQDTNMIQQSQYTPTKTVKMLYSQIQQAFLKSDGTKLAELLKQLYNDPAYNSNVERWKVPMKIVIGSRPLASLFLRMLEGIKNYQIEKLKKGEHFAFKIHLQVLSTFLKMLDQVKEVKQARDTDNLWICKPLRQVLRATKKIFLTATKKDQQSGGSVSVKKDDLIIKLQQIKTRKTLRDEVKKQILPLIDNMQVSIMLLYHNYDQISRILNNSKVYGQHGPAFADNYYFQKAKTAMIYQQFKQAEEYFQKIHLKTRGQKRLVLKYLIPCKMFLGKNFIPNPECPEEYFPQYEPIIKALNRAKFSDYNEAIKKYQKLWIKRGIYLLMDKLRTILWRNLIKKVYKILQDCKIDMQKIYKAVKLSGGQQKLDQCICITSNLIYQGMLKGYIFQSEEHKVLVLKKDGEGFPSLSR